MMLEERYLDLARTKPGSVQAQNVYKQLIDERMKHIDGTFCYITDWFPESLPLENRYGSCMHDMVRALENTGTATFGLPLPDEEPPAQAPELNVLVFSDEYGFCKGILEVVPKKLLGKKQVVTKAASSLNPKEIKQLLSPGWDIVIFAYGIDTPARNEVADVLKQQDAVAKLYFLLLQEMQKANNCKGLVCITADCFADEAEIHEECGVGLVTHGTLFGMSNTARIELEIPLLYIDTEWSLPNEAMPMLASEVFRKETFGRNTVRILKTGRYVMRQVMATQYAEAGQGELQLPKKGGIIAISGGNGALALVMGKWLMHLAQRRGATGFTIKFLSRSMKIGEENAQTWETIQRMGEHLGIIAEQAKCDVSKQSAVDEFIAEVSPNLAGFIHSAGILQDAMLGNQTWEKFEAVFDPKSRAALYLHDALERHANPDLKFFWMFSSTSVYGNMGQINYGGSNSYLDGLARHRRAMGKPAMVIQWGAWGEVGMAANLDSASKQRFQQGPQPPFTNAEGLEGLEMGIRTKVAYFGVFKYNAPVVIAGVQNSQSINHSYARHFVSNLVPLPAAKTVDDMYDFVRSQTGGSARVPLSSGLVYRHFLNYDSDEDES